MKLFENSKKKFFFWGGCRVGGGGGGLGLGSQGGCEWRGEAFVKIKKKKIGGGVGLGSGGGRVGGSGRMGTEK